MHGLREPVQRIILCPGIGGRGGGSVHSKCFAMHVLHGADDCRHCIVHGAAKVLPCMGCMSLLERQLSASKACM